MWQYGGGKANTWVDLRNKPRHFYETCQESGFQARTLSWYCIHEPTIFWTILSESDSFAFCTPRLNCANPKSSYKIGKGFDWNAIQRTLILSHDSQNFSLCASISLSFSCLVFFLLVPISRPAASGDETALQLEIMSLRQSMETSAASSKSELDAAMIKHLHLEREVSQYELLRSPPPPPRCSICPLAFFPSSLFSPDLPHPVPPPPSPSFSI